MVVAVFPLVYLVVLFHCVLNSFVRFCYSILVCIVFSIESFWLGSVEKRLVYGNNCSVERDMKRKKECAKVRESYQKQEWEWKRAGAKKKNIKIETDTKKANRAVYYWKRCFCLFFSLLSQSIKALRNIAS